MLQWQGKTDKMNEVKTMAGRIILSLCCLLCAGAFFLNGCLCRIRSSPVAFWTGGEQALKNTIKDAAGYNLEMGTAFRWYGLGWLLDAIGAAFSPTMGLAVMAALCTLGLFLLWRRYRQLLSKYS